MPQKLLLRLSRQYVTRRLRRDKRLDWDEENTGLLGLLVIADTPANRQDLSARIKDYYKLHGEEKPNLVNISGGRRLPVRGGRLGAQAAHGARAVSFSSRVQNR